MILTETLLEEALVRVLDRAPGFVVAHGRDGAMLMPAASAHLENTPKIHLSRLARELLAEPFIKPANAPDRPTPLQRRASQLAPDNPARQVITEMAAELANLHAGQLRLEAIAADLALARDELTAGQGFLAGRLAVPERAAARSDAE